MKPAVLKRLSLALAASSPDVPAPAPAPPQQEGPALLARPTGMITPQKDVRIEMHREITGYQDALRDVQEDLKQVAPRTPDHAALMSRQRQLGDTLGTLQADLKGRFVPQHSASQLISPPDLLVTRLFNARGSRTHRERLVSFDLVRTDHRVVSYQGPELRQADGLVFMSLINMARDYRVGTEVSFEPAAVCKALYGYYDGGSRARLKESLRRLVSAALTLPDFTISLVQRVNHPGQGLWSVRLDADLVRLFHSNDEVWLNLDLRRQLPEGLTTWLYGYVRAQRYMRPTALTELRAASGSDHQDEAGFKRQLYRALDTLAEHHVLLPDWRIAENTVHWKRP